MRPLNISLTSSVDMAQPLAKDVSIEYIGLCIYTPSHIICRRDATVCIAARQCVYVYYIYIAFGLVNEIDRDFIYMYILYI